MKILKVYLAGKVNGEKYQTIENLNKDKYIFYSSDGGNHSEHEFGYGRYEFCACNNDLKQPVMDHFIQEIYNQNILIAYLDSEDSYGSIAEIAYASAIGIKCYVVLNIDKLKDNTNESFPEFPEAFDTYWFVCSFPNVKTFEARNLEDAKSIIRDICSDEWASRYSNSFRFVKE